MSSDADDALLATQRPRRRPLEPSSRSTAVAGEAGREELAEVEAWLARRGRPAGVAGRR